MGRMKYIEIQVQEILEGNIETRDDDNLLVCEYLKSLDYDDFTGIAEQIKEKKIATKFKSVERARRKLQEHNPLLRGERWIERHQAQEDFKEYARGENC
jgi:hypothetical protein